MFSINRLEKKDESESLKQTIRTRVNQVEQEMFRVYGKVDNSYKNKFRSLLANISNTNNHVNSIEHFNILSIVNGCLFSSSFSIKKFFRQH